jgi:hypothetical protein
MIDEALPVWVQVGQSFKVAGDLWHVRALVDGGVLCRRWRAEKQRWHYEFFGPMTFAAWRDRIERKGEK